MLSTGSQTGRLVPFHKGDSVRRDLLRVITRSPDSQGLVPCVGQNIENRTHDPVDPDGAQLLRSRLGYLVGQFWRARSCEPHCARELSDIDLVEQTVDTAIFLIEGDG